MADPNDFYPSPPWGSVWLLLGAMLVLALSQTGLIALH